MLVSLTKSIVFAPQFQLLLLNFKKNQNKNKVGFNDVYFPKSKTKTKNTNNNMFTFLVSYDPQGFLDV